MHYDNKEISGDVVLPFCEDTTDRRMHILAIQNTSDKPAILSVSGSVQKYCVHAHGGLHMVVTENEEFVIALDSICCKNNRAFFRDGNKAYEIDIDARYPYTSCYDDLLCAYYTAIDRDQKYAWALSCGGELYYDGYLITQSPSGKPFVYMGKDAQILDTEGRPYLKATNSRFDRLWGNQYIYVDDSIGLSISSDRTVRYTGKTAVKECVSLRCFEYGFIALNRNGNAYFINEDRQKAVKRLQGRFHAIAADGRMAAAAGERTITVGRDLLSPQMTIPLQPEEYVTELDISQSLLVYKNTWQEAVVIQLDGIDSPENSWKIFEKVKEGKFCGLWSGAF